MPTELKNLNEEQQALTVVFNGINEKDSLSDFFDELFDAGSGQLIYREATVPDAVGLIDLIKKETELGRAYIPSEDKKIVFGWFIDMADLTEEWIESYLSCAADMKRLLEPDDPSYQHHVICMRHEVGSLEKDACEAKAKLLLKFAGNVKRYISKGTFLSQNIFILRKTRMEDYNSQERCIVRLLYLLSRKGKAEVVRNSIGHSLCVGMVKGAEYFEEQKERCEKEISSLNDWLNNGTDPDLERLQSKIGEIIESKLTEVNEHEKVFNRSIGYYPIRKDDYLGNIIKGFLPDWDSILPYIKINRQRFISEKIKEMLSNMDEDVSDIIRMTATEYHYPDYELMMSQFEESGPQPRSEVKDSDSLYASVIETLRTKKRIDEKSLDEQRLIFPIYDFIKIKLESSLNDIENEKYRRERRLQTKKGELRDAGEYQDLKDSFSRIVNKVQPGFIRGNEAFDTTMTALVSGNCVRNWDQYRSTIKEAPLAYACSAIAPYEIAVMMVYQVVNLDLSGDGYAGQKADEEQMFVKLEEKLLDIIS